jgi:hypothetical protein
MVIYIVCFNLQDEHNQQVEQIQFWLSFLNSSLPCSSTRPSSTQKWKIILAGLREDEKHPSSRLTTNHIATWQSGFNRLNLFQDKLFSISSHTSKNVRHLLQQIEKECQQIFDSCKILIPASYRKLLTSIQQQNFKSQSNLRFSTIREMHEMHSVSSDGWMRE